jgi:O-antigen ligase
MLGWSKRFCLPSLIEDVYAVVVLFALTQGPVLFLWLRGAATYGINVQTTIFATYLAVQIPALFLLAYLRLPVMLVRGPLMLFGLMALWLVVSAFWASASFHTVPEVVSLLVTLCTGFYFVFRFTLVRFLAVALVSMQVGLLCSTIAVFGGLSGSVGGSGEWIGIYFNRNSLAPIAATGCLLSTGLVCILADWSRPKRTLVIFGGLSVLFVLNGIVLLKTGSQTTAYALITGLIVALSCHLVLTLRNVGHSSRRRVTVSTIFVSVVSLIPWVHVLGIRQFGPMLKDIDFSGREFIWDFNFDGFLAKPIFGWGWMSAWQSNEFLRIDQWWITQGKIDGPWSHSSYFDVLLGGGIIAMLLFASSVIWLLKDRLQLPQNNRAFVGVWLTFYVLFASTQESFVVGNHFMLVLLVVGLAGPAALNAMNSTRVEEPSSIR